jgi:hypothetical protein
VAGLRKHLADCVNSCRSPAIVICLRYVEDTGYLQANNKRKKTGVPIIKREKEVMNQAKRVHIMKFLAVTGFDAMLHSCLTGVVSKLH